MAKSEQPICLVNNSTKSNTQILESLHIFLESNYKLVPWLKNFEKVCISSFACGSILMNCNVAVNSILISYQDR